jgi:hypothetical protein
MDTLAATKAITSSLKNTQVDYTANSDMLSATQLKNTKLKLQAKFKDKESDHEVIIERHQGYFYA